MFEFVAENGIVSAKFNVSSGNGVSDLIFEGVDIDGDQSQALALSILMQHYMDDAVKKSLYNMYLQGYYHGKMKKRKMTFDDAPSGLDFPDEINFDIIPQAVKDGTM